MHCLSIFEKYKSKMKAKEQMSGCMVYSSIYKQLSL